MIHIPHFVLISEVAMTTVTVQLRPALFVSLGDYKLTLAQDLHDEQTPKPVSCSGTFWNESIARRSTESMVPAVQKRPSIWEPLSVHSYEKLLGVIVKS